MFSGHTAHGQLAQAGFHQCPLMKTWTHQETTKYPRSATQHSAYSHLPIRVTKIPVVMQESNKASIERIACAHGNLTFLVQVWTSHHRTHSNLLHPPDRHKRTCKRMHSKQWQVRDSTGGTHKQRPAQIREAMLVQTKPRLGSGIKRAASCASCIPSVC